MAKIIKTTGMGLTRIFARFIRTNRNQTPWRGSRWYDCEVSSRGL
jgi:hypothetical protein